MQETASKTVLASSNTNDFGNNPIYRILARGTQSTLPASWMTCGFTTVL